MLTLDECILWLRRKPRSPGVSDLAHQLVLWRKPDNEKHRERLKRMIPRQCDFVESKLATSSEGDRS